MPIKMLPPQLANQIAAGEVVERPASVIKELVENSLDAGANQIWIEIEKGGSNLIRVRDNGCGISKNELRLSLARHATSKIFTLDDLENILSLGFRGEALASICSVSRLTLTSRPAEQNEAWSIWVDGRDQTPTMNPASHPVGTTIEVADLFFNTPARKKFLRSEKTEFSHINEVIRRIAISKPNVAITLNHNGKLIHSYKSAPNPERQLKRLSQICGKKFSDTAIQINWQYNDMHLHGWINSHSQQDLHYVYINGRIVRDKVILHAIRQAFSLVNLDAQIADWILFLEIDPTTVDVNIHPTKHEVRFQEPRLIHDFIVQGVADALNNADLQPQNLNTPASINEPNGQWTSSSPLPENRSSAGANIFTNSLDYWKHKPSPSPKNLYLYGKLLQGEQLNSPSSPPNYEQIFPAQFNQTTTGANLLHALSIVANHLLLQQGDQLFLLNLAKLQKLHLQVSLEKLPSSTTLLSPISFHLDDKQWKNWQKQQLWWQSLGFKCRESEQYLLVIEAVPILVRTQNLQQIFIGLLDINIDSQKALMQELCSQISLPSITDFSHGLRILAEVENLLQNNRKYLQDLLISLNLSSYLTQN